MKTIRDKFHELQYTWWMRDPMVAAEVEVATTFQPPLSETMAAPMPTARRIVRGVDVSSWQGKIDWEKLASRGVEMAYIRAGNGLAADTRFAENWVNAKAAGIQRGAYHYFLCNLDSTRQADFFFETVTGVDGSPGDQPPAGDFERSGAYDPYPQKDYQVRAMTYMLRMETLWLRTPAIYSAWAWLSTYFTLPDWQRFLLWIANWQNNAPRIPLPFWPNYFGWQFNVHKTAGPYYGMASQGIDLDLFNIYE